MPYKNIMCSDDVSKIQIVLNEYLQPGAYYAYEDEELQFEIIKINGKMLESITKTD